MQNKRTNTNESMTGMMLQSRMSRNNAEVPVCLSENKMAPSGNVANSTQAQFWYNPDQNQYYLIDWRGNKSLCDNGGRQKITKKNPAQNGGGVGLTTYGSFNKGSIIH